MTLTKRRILFDEPIVRVKISKVRFPKCCPVCGASADRLARVSSTPKRKVWLRPSWDPNFNSKGNNRLENTQIKSLLVEVCELHQMSDNAELKIRGLSVFLAALIIGISLFALIYAGSDYWLGRPVNPWVYSYIVILFFSLLFGYIAFRPSPLEDSIKIVGFDFEMQYVWLQLKNRDYMNQLMAENPMSIELVNWIVKV